MDGNYWIGRKVYIILRNKRNYQGVIVDIDESSPPLVFITLLDKFDNKIMFIQSEIEVLQEEK